MGKPVRKEKKLLHPVNWMQDVSPLLKRVRSFGSPKPLSWIMWYAFTPTLTCYNGQGPPSVAPLRRPFVSLEKIVGSEWCNIQNECDFAIDASRCQQYIFIILPTKVGFMPRVGGVTGSQVWPSHVTARFQPIPMTAFSPWVAETRRIGTWVSSKVPRPWKISNGDFLRDRGRGHLLIVNELVLDCIYEAKSHLHQKKFQHSSYPLRL